MTIYDELVLDLAQKNNFRTVIVKQFDYNARFLKIRLKNSGEPISVEQGSYVTINALRADNKSKIFRGIVNSDGTVCAPITTWISELAEKVKCDVSIISPKPEQKCTTMTFNVLVDEACAPSSILPEDENYDILVSLIADCDAAKKACDEAAENANAKAQLADEKAKEAKTAADSANTAKAEADEARDRANAAADNANEKADLADKAAGNADVKAQLAEEKAGEAKTAADSANTAKAEADAARDRANTAAEGAETAKAETEKATAGANTAANRATSATDAANKAAADAGQAADAAKALTDEAVQALKDAQAVISEAKDIAFFIDENDFGLNARILKEGF